MAAGTHTESCTRPVNNYTASHSNVLLTTDVSSLWFKHPCQVSFLSLTTDTEPE